MNRGVSKRFIFPDATSVQAFLALVARSLRRGEVEVHAYTLLTNHYHLLVRSLRGQLSRTMARIQRPYAYWFNRRHGRDGPLFRGRFRSRRVLDARYRRILVRYIDFNPVVAGLVERPEHYPYGSARQHVSNTAPPWLETSWIQAEAMLRAHADRFRASAYHAAFGDPTPPRDPAHAATPTRGFADGERRLDDLLGAASDEIDGWLRDRVQAADGLHSASPPAPKTLVLEDCARRESSGKAWIERRGNNSLDVWEVLRVGLLREMSRLRWSEIATLVGLGSSSTRRRYRIHLDWMETSTRYRQTAESVRDQVGEAG